jgi:hypothetical protein
MKRLIPRKFERKRLVGQASLRTVPEGRPVRVEVLDLGQSGLALFASHCLPNEQLVEIQFPLVKSVARAQLPTHAGRVVRGRANPDGNIMAIEFSKPLAEEELKYLETHWMRS